MFRVILTRNAQRDLDRLDPALAQRVVFALDSLTDNPFFGTDIRKLRGRLERKYRLRVGPVRVVYRVLIEDNIVRVEDIAHRGSIY